MDKKYYTKFILFLVIGLTGSAFIWWIYHDPVSNFKVSIPGMDKRGQKSAVPAEAVKIGDSFAFYKVS